MKEDVARAILGLEGEKLSAERINKAYREAMQMNHPDRYANNEELRRHAEYQSRLINEARQVLLSRVQDEDDPAAPSSDGKVGDQNDWEGQARWRAAYYERPHEHVPNDSGYSSNKRQEHGKQHATSQGTVSREDHGVSEESNGAAATQSSGGHRCGGCGIAAIITAILFFFIIIGYSNTTYQSGTSSDTRGASPGKSTAEVSYTSNSKGFSAQFPEKPDIEKRIETVESMGGKVSTTSFYGDSGVSFTYVHIVDAESLALTVNHSMQERDRNKWLGNMISESLDSFDQILTPKGKIDEVSYGSERGYPSATLVMPCTYRPKGSSKSAEVFYYASCVVSYSKVYLVTGARPDREASQKALDSFHLRDIVYKSKRLGFKAAFPETPSNVGKKKVSMFYASGSAGDTEITIARSKSLAVKFKGLARFRQREAMNEIVTTGMGYSLRPHGVKYSKVKGAPRATLVQRIKTRSGKPAYYYALFAVGNNSLYELYGTRSTKKAAGKALRSFKVL